MQTTFFLPLCFLATLLAVTGTDITDNLDSFDGYKEVSRQKRIVGGRLVTKYEFEFVVLIRGYCNSVEYICTGSIISKKHVLTAGHCITCLDDNKFKIYAEKIFIGARGSGVHNHTYRLEQHGWYDPKTLKNDIGIIELISGEEFDVPPVTLPADLNEHEIFNLTALGYGRYENRDWNGNLKLDWDAQLRVAEIPILWFKSDTMYGGMSRKMMIQGDTGGPLVKSFGGKVYQFGMASWFTDNVSQILSDDTHNTKNRNRFIKIPAYCYFIQHATNNLVKCEKVLWR